MFLGRSSLITCGTGFAILLLAMMFTSALCRQGYTPRGFSLWLVLWNGVAAQGVLLCVAVVFTIVMMIDESGAQEANVADSDRLGES